MNYNEEDDIVKPAPFQAGDRVYAIEVAPDSVSRDYLPRTPLGTRLLALRRAYVANGGRLRDAEQLDGEMRIRRGGAVDD